MGFKDKLKELKAVSKLQFKLAEVLPNTSQRNELMRRIHKISKKVDCPHNESQILSYIVDLFSLSPDLKGSIVEAGAYKGGSTAKVSIVAKHLGRDLLVFDSFEGLPENEEEHKSSILGHSIDGWFEEGKFKGTLDEVKQNITQFGEIDSCQFIQGWFDDTMPDFKQDLVAIYLDVDLASSTQTCLKFLYPQLVSGGILYSQDGDFPLVIDVFKNEEFWKEEVGCEIPEIIGLGTSKMLKIIKK